MFRAEPNDKKKEVKLIDTPFFVPRAGVEPAQG